MFDIHDDDIEERESFFDFKKTRVLVDEREDLVLYLEKDTFSARKQSNLGTYAFSNVYCPCGLIGYGVCEFFLKINLVVLRITHTFK